MSGMKNENAILTGSDKLDPQDAKLILLAQARMLYIPELYSAV